MNKAITRWLERAPAPVFSTYCIAAAFGTYFCMYAFRKPFTAATYEETALFGVAYKTVLITSQVLGYTLSKFIGIRVVSEMPPHRRAFGILALIAAAHAALLLFGLTPAPYNFVFLFMNGLPLGMVFGLVLGFLEGRRFTEALSAGLCASFIVASGAVKSAGQALLLYFGVGDYWMPFFAGALFWPPLLVSVWLLARIPPPSTADETLRSRREPIDASDRLRTFRRYAPGLVLLIATYMLLTVLRSLRDDFAVEIWNRLGMAGEPAVFAKSETVVMFAVIALNGAAFLIRDNRRAFRTALYTIASGFLILIAATLAFEAQWLGGFAFMVAVGVGTYVPYVAYHTTLFERMIAVFRDKTNLGYLMYLADAFGYLGYVAVLFLSNFGSIEGDFLSLLERSSLLIGVVSLLMVFASALYFTRKIRAAAAPPAYGPVVAASPALAETE